MKGNSPDLAELETEFLALVFEALINMPAEFWLTPGAPGEYSGELSKAENEEEWEVRDERYIYSS